MTDINIYISLALIMFSIGLIGVVLRRNLIMILISSELILNSANIVFVAASKYHSNLDGQIAVIFVISIAACEAAVGLSMIVAIFRKYGSIETNFFRSLKG